MKFVFRLECSSIRLTQRLTFTKFINCTCFLLTSSKKKPLNIRSLTLYCRLVESFSMFINRARISMQIRIFTNAIKQIASEL